MIFLPMPRMKFIREKHNEVKEKFTQSSKIIIMHWSFDAVFDKIFMIIFHLPKCINANWIFKILFVEKKDSTQWFVNLDVIKA